MDDPSAGAGPRFQFKSLLVGLGAMLAIQCVGAAADLLVGTRGAWIAAIVAAVVLAFRLIDRHGVIQVFALILGTAGTIALSLVSLGPVRLLWAAEVHGASPADAPMLVRSGLGILHFSEGAVVADLVGEAGEHFVEEEASGVERRTETRFRVAPLVPDGWTSADPVPAWVACSDTVGDYGFLADGITGCTARWREPLGAGYLVPRDRLPGCEAARAKAEEDHGLRSAPDAPFLVWTADPRGELTRQVRPILIVLAALHLAWPIGFLAALLRRRRRSRRQAPGSS